MNDQDFLKFLQRTNQQLEHLAEKLKSLNEPGEWERWFAWYPVYTVSDQRIWLKRIYRRRESRLIKSMAEYEYATDFDLLKMDKE